MSKIKIIGLVVLILLVILIGIPSFERGVKPEIAQTRIELGFLIKAIEAYDKEYGTFPQELGGGAIESKIASANLKSTLGGENLKGIKFIDVQSALFGRGEKDGNALSDLWGNFYRIKIDVDRDGVVEDPYNNTNYIKAGVIAWSLGPDGKQKTPDDIVSWK